ncbi:MAG: alcohol dehydrogenase, partial [Armatimonadaceae bacterium]
MADWPHFRGIDRTGISKETGLPDRLATAPRRLWSANVGEGYSTVSIADGLAFALGNQGGNDVLQALDAANGKVRWQ